jgi:AAA domain/Bifunctional DNA primase/polymerase, N-terminal
MSLPTFDDNDKNHEAALARASQGFRVFPCNGKHPCFKVYWRSQATTTPAEVTRFWGRFAGAAPAINVGPHLVVVDADLDGDNDGMAWLLMRCPADELDAFVATPGCRTPSAGRHLYFRNSGRVIGCGRGRLPPKHTCNVDVKGDGGYVIAPGADTSAWGGGIYELIGDLSILPELPDWLRYELEPAAWEKPERPAGAEVIPLRPDPGKASYGQAALASIIAELAAVQPGSRSNELWEKSCKAGELVAGGCFSLEQATAALEGVAKGIWGLPLNDKALGPQGTIARGLRQGISNRARGPDSGSDDDDIEIRLKVPGAEAKPEAEAKEPAFDFKPYVWTDPTTIPLRPWVYGSLMRGIMVLTGAPGGLGKSSLTVVEALAMVTGKPLLRVEPVGLLRVAICNLEETRDEMMRKVQAAAKHYNITAEDIGDRLFVNDKSTKLVMAVMDRNGVRIVRPVVERLVERLQTWKIDVLIIDPFVSTNRAPENDNNAQDEISKEWGAIAERCNCAAHLVDHTRKLGPDGEVTAESVRGGKAKVDASRATRILNRMTKSQGDEAGVENHKLYFRAYVDKDNYAPPAENSDWYKLESVSLNNDPNAVVVLGARCAKDDKVGVVTPWKYPNALEGMTGKDFEKVAAALRSGKWRASPSAHAWAGYEVGRVLNIDTGTRAGKARVSRMLKRWIAAGGLAVVEQYVKEDRKSYPFIQVTDGDEEYDDTEEGEEGGI